MTNRKDGGAANDPIQMAIDALEYLMASYSSDIERAIEIMADLGRNCDPASSMIAQTKRVTEYDKVLSALRQHQQDGGWLPIETLTDAEGDIILLNSDRNLVLSMDAKRWRSTIGYPDHLHFHADYWKQINPPAPKKENDDG